MVSTVIVGRNDNYGGNFESTLMDTVLHNTRGLETRTRGPLLM